MTRNPSQHSARRRATSVGVLVMLLGALGLAAASAPTLLETHTEAEANPAHPWQPFDAYPVKLYDIDGDGRKEILDHNDNRYIYVLDSATGALLAELTTTFPPGWGARTLNGIEAAVLEPGAPPSLVVTNSAAYVTRFDYDAANSTATHFAFVKKWERRLNAFHGNPGMDAKAVVQDVNGNGKAEIFAMVEERGLYALRQDGSVLWQRNQSGGNAEPLLVDWDRDGHIEALFFSDDGHVRAYTALNGTYEWGFDAKEHIGWPGSISRAGAVAQLDTGRWDIVFCARDAHDAQNYTNNHFGLFAIGNDDMDLWANLKWLRQPTWGMPLCYTRPVIYDYNGNGKPEIYGMDWNTMGYNPGNWERLGPAHVFAFTSTGTQLWKTTLDSWWSNKDIAIADFDGDAQREVLAHGPSADGSQDGWWVLDINNGTKRDFLSVDPYKSSRGPRLGDLDGDGDLEFVVPVEGHTGGTEVGEGAFQVWEAHTNASRVVWSGGEDKPARGAPFTATFLAHNDSNEFYVKLHVTSFHHVIKAWFNEDGGAWQALDRLAGGADWTLWDKAAEVPAGTQVRFKIQDDLGKAIVSGPVTWPP